MAKQDSNNGSGGQGGGSKRKSGGGYALPDALKEAGPRAAELAQNPVARSMLAAGRDTAPAPLPANPRGSRTVRDASRDALDTAEAAASGPSTIGAAIVTAATD